MLQDHFFGVEGVGGGGGPSFGSERTVQFFCGKLLPPNTPSHQSQLHITILMMISFKKSAS